MKEKLYASSNLRLSATNGLCMLMKRRREASPQVLTFCMDSAIRAQATRIYKTDRDEGARLSAYYLLKALLNPTSVYLINLEQASGSAEG